MIEHRTRTGCKQMLAKEGYDRNKVAETAKIPCAVCRDLMPLVQDGVASPDSEALVQAHMAVALPVAPCGRERTTRHAGTARPG